MKYCAVVYVPASLELINFYKGKLEILQEKFWFWIIYLARSWPNWSTYFLVLLQYPYTKYSQITLFWSHIPFLMKFQFRRKQKTHAFLISFPFFILVFTYHRYDVIDLLFVRESINPHFSFSRFCMKIIINSIISISKFLPTPCRIHINIYLKIEAESIIVDGCVGIMEEHYVCLQRLECHLPFHRVDGKSNRNSSSRTHHPPAHRPPSARTRRPMKRAGTRRNLPGISRCTRRKGFP